MADEFIEELWRIKHERTPSNAVDRQRTKCPESGRYQCQHLVDVLSKEVYWTVSTGGA